MQEDLNALKAVENLFQAKFKQKEHLLETLQNDVEETSISKQITSIISAIE